VVRIISKKYIILFSR